MLLFSNRWDWSRRGIRVSRVSRSTLHSVGNPTCLRILRLFDTDNLKLSRLEEALYGDQLCCSWFGLGSVVGHAAQQLFTRCHGRNVNSPTCRPRCSLLRDRVPDRPEVLE